MSKNKAGLSTGLFCYRNAKDLFWQWKSFRIFLRQASLISTRKPCVFFIDEFVLVILNTGRSRKNSAFLPLVFRRCSASMVFPRSAKRMRRGVIPFPCPSEQAEWGRNRRSLFSFEDVRGVLLQPLPDFVIAITRSVGKILDLSVSVSGASFSNTAVQIGICHLLVE